MRIYYPRIDKARWLLAYLILIIHFRPLSGFNPTVDFASAQVVARIAVPFYFMATGFFMDYDQKDKVKAWLKNILKLTLLWSLIYLPFRIQAYLNGKANILMDIVHLGVHVHLWYLPASILAVLLLGFLIKHVKIKTILLMGFMLYFIGLFGDAYYGFSHMIGIENLVDDYLYVFETTRNGLFFGLFFVSLGYSFRTHPLNIKSNYKLGGFIIGFILMFVEMLSLENAGIPIEYNMYLSIIPTVYFLFSLCMEKTSTEKNKSYKDLGTFIYFSHFIVLYLSIGLFMLFKLEWIFYNNLFRFFYVAIVSTLLGQYSQKRKLKRLHQST
jgi:serine/alanine racemase